MPATSAAIESRQDCRRLLVGCGVIQRGELAVGCESSPTAVVLNNPLPPGSDCGEGFRSRVAGLPEPDNQSHRATSCVRGGAHRTEIACPFLVGWRVSDLAVVITTAGQLPFDSMAPLGAEAELPDDPEDDELELPLLLEDPDELLPL